MVYRGHVANGVIQLDEPVALPEGAEVRVELAASPVNGGFHDAIERELDRLASLPVNWDHEGAPQIDRAIIQSARNFIARLPSNAAPIAAVVPSATGNLQFEWNAGRRSLELEIESPSTIHYLKWDPDAAVEEEDVFSIEDIGFAVRLMDWFSRGSSDARRKLARTASRSSRKSSAGLGRARLVGSDCRSSPRSKRWPDRVFFDPIFWTPFSR